MKYITDKHIKQLEEKGKTELNISDFDFVTIVKNKENYSLIINGKVFVCEFFYELSGVIETFIKKM